MSNETRGNTSALLIDEVREEIDYFRRCIREAGPLDSAQGRAARLTYEPFLQRRLGLLCALKGKRWPQRSIAR